MLFVLLGCLIQEERYEARKEALTDHDGDGFVQEDDCDDADITVFPGASERCNGADDDCDGQIDEQAADAGSWWPDGDGDGFGDEDGAPVSACSAPAGHVGDATDCDDDRSGVHPGAEDVPYDGVDQDCDGGDLVDVDGDGSVAVEAGEGDCDDADAGVYPSAPETWADGFTDNDCDGEVEVLRLMFGSEAWIGATTGGQAGRRVGALGDVTGDGLAEYLVGAVYEASVYPGGGAVYLVPGGSAAGELADAHALVPGGEGWYLPQVIEGGPDLDADGVPDFVATATGYESSTGAAFLVSGALFAAEASLSLPDDVLGVVTGNRPGDFAGTAAAFLGDVVGDGGQYLAVSAVFADVDGGSDAGALALFETSSLGSYLLGDGQVQVDGPYAAAGMGNLVGPAGDVDADGVDDYFVSVEYGDIAYVVPGGLGEPSLPGDAIFRLTGAGAGDACPAEMLGDVDGDGRRDLACIYEHDEVRVFTTLSAVPVRTVDDATATIELGEGSLAYDLLDLGDLDADARSETLVPVQWFPDLATSLAVIVPGESLGFRATVHAADVPLSAASLRTDGRFGYRVAKSSDVDGDGAEDVILGGYSDSEGGADAGAALTIPVPR